MRPSIFIFSNLAVMALTIVAITGSVIMPRTGSADGQPYIAVGSAKSKKPVVAVPGIRSTSDLELFTKTMTDTVSGDLLFMDLFKVMGAAASIEDATRSGIAPNTFKFSDWSSIGAEFVLKANLTREGSNLTLEAYLYDVSQGTEVFGKRYVATSADIKTMAHTLANNVVESLTGQPGIFLTKIAMSCDLNGKKEIYMMNFDGTEPKQVTQHRSIAFAPAWSPDATRLAYSVYTRHRNNVKNIDLYEFDFTSSTYRMLSNRKGINSGAAYSPDGKTLALTMSFLGNPEIFSLNPVNNTVTRLTHSYGFDVDPAWSPDGKSIAFVSSRSGKPMVYRMDANGANPQRLTFAGVYNATPSWSAQSGKIVFAGWLDKHFDIFTMNSDGSHIERLTKDQHNNEDPNFSPDGNFIAFSSNRSGTQNIYVMNSDGSFVKRMTYGMGNCTAPKWSNPPK